MRPSLCQNARAPQSIQVSRQLVLHSKTTKVGGISSGLRFIALRFFCCLDCSLPGTPSVNKARLNPSVILSHAAEMRVQIIGLAPEGNVVVVPVVRTASQGHGKAIKRQIAPRGMLPSEQHLPERRYPAI